MNLVDRAKKIILTPALEWQAIKTEPLSVAEMFTGYAMILAAIPSVAGFIGYALMGYSVDGNFIKGSVSEGLLYAILTYALSLASVYVLALIIDALAPNFGCRKDFTTALKIAVFSYTATWIAGVFRILPGLSWLSILGLYSLYLMYVGLRELKEVSQDKIVGYYALSLVAAVVMWMVIGTVISLIVAGL
jgi:hypothetical protein